MRIKNNLKIVRSLVLIGLIAQNATAASTSWSDTFKNIPASIFNWARENQGKALIGGVAGLIVTYACYRGLTSSCAVKSEDIQPLPGQSQKITTETTSVAQTSSDEVWGNFKNNDFKGTQEQLKEVMRNFKTINNTSEYITEFNRMHSQYSNIIQKNENFQILLFLKNFILNPHMVQIDDLQKRVAGANFVFDLYTLLYMNDLIDTPYYSSETGSTFYFRQPSKRTKCTTEFKQLQGWDPRIKKPVSETTKNTYTHLYKIHLMPQKSEFIPVILKISQLLKNNSKLSDLVDGAKIDLNYINDYDRLSQKNNASVFPGVILYVFQNPAKTQNALDMLYKELKDFKGSGIRPRFNAQVNDLIYIAQGNADDKIKEKWIKTGLFETPDMIYYNPAAFDEPNANYHLKYPDTNIEIIEPERPENTYPK